MSALDRAVEHYQFDLLTRKSDKDDARSELAQLRAAVADRDAAIARERAEERERIARWFDILTDEEEKRWNDFIQSGSDGPATSFHLIYRWFAAAIRARGEAKE